MRRAAAALAIGAALAACSPRELALSDDPLTRATTCTAVRALELREGQADESVMSFAGFSEILHFGMLAAAQGEEALDVQRLVTVSHRAPTMMEELSARNWQSLVDPCNAAFPETQRPAPPLGEAPFDAGMTCFALADFFARTAADYPDEQRRFAALADRALAAARPELARRAADEAEATRIAGGYAARAAQAGTPGSLLEQCMRRFPPED